MKPRSFWQPASPHRYGLSCLSMCLLSSVSRGYPRNQAAREEERGGGKDGEKIGQGLLPLATPGKGGHLGCALGSIAVYDSLLILGRIPFAVEGAPAPDPSSRGRWRTDVRAGGTLVYRRRRLGRKRTLRSGRRALARTGRTIEAVWTRLHAGVDAWTDRFHRVR